ncbi:MAG: hypothetical protein QXV18_04135, partial [Candidatus Nitrosocaldus sp.]
MDVCMYRWMICISKQYLIIYSSSSIPFYIHALCIRAMRLEEYAYVWLDGKMVEYNDAKVPLMTH